MVYAKPKAFSHILVVLALCDLDGGFILLHSLNPARMGLRRSHKTRWSKILERAGWDVKGILDELAGRIMPAPVTCRHQLLTNFPKAFL